MRRHLDVTANTTFDHLQVRAEGDGWTDETVAVLDVESPRDEQTVRVGFELDPDVDVLPHHATYVTLAPGEARRFAEDLDAAAAAADRGEAMTSGRH